jgi:Mg-chelatase subunit ChlD
MNPDQPSRGEIEAKLTALLLGELPDEEARLLRWAIAQDVELAQLHDRLKVTIGLVREVTVKPTESVPLKLSDERRKKLLAHFKTPRSKPSIWLRPIVSVPRFVTVLALVALVALVAAMLLPVLSASKSRGTYGTLHGGAWEAFRESFLSSVSSVREDAAANSAGKQATDGELKKESLQFRTWGADNSGGTPLAAAAPPATTPTTITVASEPVLAPPPVQIFLPPAESPSPVTAVSWSLGDSGQAGVPSQNSAGNANVQNNFGLPSPAPATPSPGGGALPAVEAERKREQKNFEGRGQYDGFFIPQSESTPAMASQTGAPVDSQIGGNVQNAGVVNAFAGASGFGGFGGGGFAGNIGGTTAPQRAKIISNGAVDQLGVESSLTPNTPNNATLAWDDAGVNRLRAENPPAKVGRGFSLMGPDAGRGETFSFQTDSSSRQPTTGLPEGKLPGVAGNEISSRDAENSFAAGYGLATDGSDFDRGVAVAQSRAGGGDKFYRQPARGIEANKTPVPALSDTPSLGTTFALRHADVPASVLAQPSAGEPARAGAVYLGDLETSQNQVETAKALRETSTGTMALNSVNSYSWPDASVVNDGQLALGVSKDPFQTGRTKEDAVALRYLTTTNAVIAQKMETVPDALVVSEQVLRQANVTLDKDKSPPKATLPALIPQPEILTRENAFSTFSLNVSDVSFKLAAASLEKGLMPDAASIRSEEFINAFDYRDPEAAAGQPLAFAAERVRYPFAHNRDLLRFSVKTAAAGRPAGRALNLVLLLDNSGSMERADRVQIIREALRVLATQLQPQDTVSVVTFARTARLWADGVAGDKAGETLDQVGGITPQGGTNLEEAMRLAYETARRHYLANGMNCVVLLTDGAANLGNVDAAVLKKKVEAQRKQGIALDCFGIGWEGFNDDLLEQLSSNGDGRYAFINSPEDAGMEFAAKLAGALQVAAQDVKVQVEFNPQRVVSWRQIGYAKHQLTKEQFRDNTVDAAEIAAQEAGNALYTVETKPDGSGPVATVRVRYKVPGTTDYRERSWDVPYAGNAVSLEQSSAAMRLAATASAFSEWLASSPFAQEVTPDELLKDLSGVPEVYGADARPKKLEWMIRQAKSLSGK